MASSSLALYIPFISIVSCPPPSSQLQFSVSFETLTPVVPISCRKRSYKHLQSKHALAIAKGTFENLPAAARGFNRESYEENGKEDEEEEISRATLIWRAIKLPIYSVALIPLSVGSAAAYLQTGLFFTKRYLTLLFSSILIITWLNLSNDVYDFDTGADKDKKESVVNIVGSRMVTLLAANTSLVLGFVGLICGSVEAGDVRAIYLLTCAILCGFIYQCPPFRLSYHGLGEPLCFAAFGPFATTAFYFMQSSKSGMFQLPLTSTVLSASILVGLTTSLILFCSHFHQVDSDQAVGKMSPLVRIGTKLGSDVVKVAITTLYLLVLAFGVSKALPVICTVLCALTVPVGKTVVDYIKENYDDKIKIFMAKYYCVRLHALFGAALTAGLVAARTVSGRSKAISSVFSQGTGNFQIG